VGRVGAKTARFDGLAEAAAQTRNAAHPGWRVGFRRIPRAERKPKGLIFLDLAKALSKDSPSICKHCQDIPLPFRAFSRTSAEAAGPAGTGETFPPHFGDFFGMVFSDYQKHEGQCNMKVGKMETLTRSTRQVRPKAKGSAS
jgi:hypothetical protein